MKKKLQYLVIFLSALILIAGCAGGRKKFDNNTMPAWVKLPQTVSESFSYNITDKQARKMILEIETGKLGPPNRLEVKLLQQLALIEHPGAMRKAFDQVWEGDKALRDIFQQKESPSEFNAPLALSYYILTYDDMYDWRDRKAETIYKQTLCEIKPEQLKGYSLHYYTLALLNSGNFDNAWIFLMQLKKITTPPIYLKNLNIALDYAIENKNPHFVGKITHQIIKHCQQNDLKVPEENIAAALAKMKETADIETVADVLCADNLDTEKLKNYSFYQYIAPFRQAEPVKHPEIKTQGKEQPKEILTTEPKKQAIEKVKPKQKTFEKTMVIQEVSAKSETEKIKLCKDAVRIRVQTISADNKADYIDPQLKDIGFQLKKSLQMSQIYLKNDSAFLLTVGRQERMKINHDHDVSVLLKNVSADNARIDITVRKDSKEIFNTVIDSVDNGETIIGGPKIDDTHLILRITTWQNLNDE